MDHILLKIGAFAGAILAIVAVYHLCRRPLLRLWQWLRNFDKIADLESKNINLKNEKAQIQKKYEQTIRNRIQNLPRETE